MKENLRLKRENEELRKETAFLKKAAAILCKRNRFEAYRFIDQHHEEFGTRWLLRRLRICPNAYYNYRKHRKADYYAKKQQSRKRLRKSTTGTKVLMVTAA